MYWIKEIMKLLNCSEEDARKVFDAMDIDFSEATTEVFEREVYDTVIMGWSYDTANYLLNTYTPEVQNA